MSKARTKRPRTENVLEDTLYVYQNKQRIESDIDAALGSLPKGSSKATRDAAFEAALQKSLEDAPNPSTRNMLEFALGSPKDFFKVFVTKILQRDKGERDVNEDSEMAKLDPSFGEMERYLK